MAQHTMLTLAFVTVCVLSGQEVGPAAMGETAWRKEAERERAAGESQEKPEAEPKRAYLRPGRNFRECPHCPLMVVVPAGSFLAGSTGHERGRSDLEGATRHGTIAKPFAVGKYEVTKREFGVFVRATGRDMGNDCGYFDIEESEWKSGKEFSWRNPGFEQTDLDPVVCVNLHDAQAYVKWLTEKTGKSYRLLSDVEWEYASLTNTGKPHEWGDGTSGQCNHANGADRTFKDHYGNRHRAVASCRDGFAHTAPAGSFLANGFGLHDMLGNASEWVEGGCLAILFEPFGLKRLCNQRGGSWLDEPGEIRFTALQHGFSDSRENINGFRVARTLVP